MTTRYSSRDCVVCGADNAIGLRVQQETDGSQVWTTTRFPRHFQGFGNMVHGGLVSALLDDTLWYSCYVHGHFTVTGELTIRYRRPVPLETDVFVRARMTAVRKRLCEAEAQLWLGPSDQGELLASARGKFIVVPEDEIQDPLIEEV